MDPVYKITDTILITLLQYLLHSCKRKN